MWFPLSRASRVSQVLSWPRLWRSLGWFPSSILITYFSILCIPFPEFPVQLWPPAQLLPSWGQGLPVLCLRTALGLAQNLGPDYLGPNKKGALGQGQRGGQLSRKKKQQIEGPRSPEQDHYPATKSSTEVARGRDERNRLLKKGRKKLGWEGG